MNSETPAAPPNPAPQGPPPGYGYPPGYAPQRTPGRAGCIVAVGIALLLGCLVFGAMVLITSMVGAGLNAGTADLREHLVDGNPLAKDKVLRIQIHGAIMGKATSPFGGGGAVDWETVRAYLRQARRDSAIKAILLDVDSPGGSVTECEYIVHELQLFRDEMKKNGRTIPVVALYGDMAASGGVYVSAGADWIVCSPTCTTGSIGVIMSYLNFAGLAQEHGVSEVVIKSGKMKNLLSRFATPGDEEKRILESLVMGMHARFVDTIAAGRVGRNGLTKEKIAELADGRVYSSQQALEHGLVDQVGYSDDAFAKILSLTGSSDAQVVEYRSPPTLAQVLSGSQALAPRTSLKTEIEGALRLDAPRLLFLWNGR